jgi:hypothetical protein
MTIKETILPLADAYATAGFAEGGAGNHMFPFEIESKAAKRKEARAALCAALDAADRELEQWKKVGFTWDVAKVTAMVAENAALRTAMTTLLANPTSKLMQNIARAALGDGK